MKGRGSAYVAVAALIAVALALVVMKGPELSSEMVQKVLDRSAEAHKARLKKDIATAKAVAKIQKKMMQSLDITSAVFPNVDPTQSVRDEILKEENDIASLKLSTGNLFAQWEKERTIARDAKTKSVSLHEVLQQDKTKERMEVKDLEALKEKLTRELSSRGGDGKPVKATAEKGFTAGDSRHDLTSYFAKLNQQDKKQEAASHADVVKTAAKLEAKGKGGAGAAPNHAKATSPAKSGAAAAAARGDEGVLKAKAATTPAHKKAGAKAASKAK